MSEYETELEKVREELKHGLDSKRHRIMDLVKILEALGTKKHRIATRIAHDLSDVVTHAWVDEVLGDEYKMETKPKKEVTSDKIQLVESSESEIINENGTVSVIKGGDVPVEDESLPEAKRTVIETTTTIQLEPGKIAKVGCPHCTRTFNLVLTKDWKWRLER